MNVTPELALFLVVAAASSLVEAWLYPRFMRAVAAGDPRARTRYYAGDILVLWAFAGWLLTLWAMRQRPWSALGLSAGSPWRLAAGGALFLAYIYLALKQRRRALLARPERLRKAFTPPMEALTPHTPGELRGFVCLALTAGFCEELLVRGYFTWYLSLWCGLPLAMAGSAILFGVQHLYLGIKHVGSTAVAGALFSLVVLISGSLWPAILIHAAIDLFAGDLGYHVFAIGSLPASGPPAQAAG